MGFDADTALRPAGEGVWEGAVVDGWNTPRGPLGGYVMAIVMRGLELAVADPERQARSATMHFLRAPEPGPVTVTAQVERTGRSLTSVSGRLEQDGTLLGLALGRVLEAVVGTAARRVPDARCGAPRPGGRAVPGPARRHAAAVRAADGDAAPVRRAAVQPGGPQRDRRLARDPRGAPGRLAGRRGARRRLVPGAVAAAERARARAHDRPHGPFPIPPAGRPGRCCSAAFAAATCATGSSRRTASSGRRTAPWWPSRVSWACLIGAKTR